jgi:hypothetical protein
MLALLLDILWEYFTEFMKSFVWFKFSYLHLDTLLKTLLKHEKDKHYDGENYICYFALICSLIKHINLQTFTHQTGSGIYLISKTTTTKGSKRIHYNHLNWHLFQFTVSKHLAFRVLFCSIYYYCSQTCLHQQNILRITYFDFMNCWRY